MPSSKLAEEHAFGSTITNNGSRPLFSFWVKKSWKIHDFAIFKAISKILRYFLVPLSKLAEEHAFGSTIATYRSRALFSFWVKKAWKIHDFATLKPIS